MKQLVFSIPALVLLVLGCAASPNQSVASPASSDHDLAVASPSGSGPSCAQDLALVCADGVDGCVGNRTTVHVCVAATATAGPSCSQEIALECPDGETDGCLLSPAVSTAHICVRR